MSLDAIATSAFGRRAVTRAQIEAQLAVREARAAARTQAPEGGQGAAVHKWTLLRTLSEIREGLAVSDRSLGVLSALLSFHPETALTLDPQSAPMSATGESRATTRRSARGGPETAMDGARHEDDFADAHAGLVVFPSNKALQLRCNGMSEATLRRHLSALVEAGLIIRRDSPNGKRFARREGDGEGFAQAFGFDLSPLVARSEEFDAQLHILRAEQRRARLLKERINLLRRDLTKRLAFALDEGLAGPWEGLRQTFLGLCTPLRKLRGPSDVATLARELDRLQESVSEALALALEAPAKTFERNKHSSGQDSSAYAAHFRRRISESNTEQIQESDPASKKAGGGDAPERGSIAPSSRDIPLGLVLEACPDIRDYDFSGGRVEDWRAFVALAALVRPMLGISPDAWRDANEAMGERDAAIAIAFILQRSEHSSDALRGAGPDGKTIVTVHGSPAIRSPGGYLRVLAQNARTEPRSLWSAILGQLAQRAKGGARPQRL